MMTWMTTKSLFDTAESLAMPQLALAQAESYALFNELVWGEPDPDHGEAPPPLRAMWRGYETALAAYSVAAAAILVKHGIGRTSPALEMAKDITSLRQQGDPAEYVEPPWFQDVDVLRSHRSNLMRRWPQVYNWPRTTADMPYIWPVVDGEGGYELRLSKYDKELLAEGERHLPTSILERISNA